jgi:hypothetical protein
MKKLSDDGGGTSCRKLERHNETTEQASGVAKSGRFYNSETKAVERPRNRGSRAVKGNGYKV